MRAGNLRRSSTPECDPQTENHPTRMEERVLVQAVVSSKLPALTSSDAGIFKEILRDVWPRVEIDDPTEPDLRTSIVTALENRGLVQDDGQVCTSDQRCQMVPWQCCTKLSMTIQLPHFQPYTITGLARLYSLGSFTCYWSSLWKYNTFRWPR